MEAGGLSPNSPVKTPIKIHLTHLYPYNYILTCLAVVLKLIPWTAVRLAQLINTAPLYTDSNSQLPSDKAPNESMRAIYLLQLELHSCAYSFGDNNTITYSSTRVFKGDTCHLLELAHKKCVTDRCDRQMLGSDPYVSVCLRR